MDCEAIAHLTPSTSPLFYDLLLLRLPDLGPQRYWQICEYFGSAADLWRASSAELRQRLPAELTDVIEQIQRQGMRHSLVATVEREIDWCQEHQVAIVAASSPDYPPLLREVAAAPPVLFVKGSVDNLHLPQLAMVGSRNPSPSGRDNAFHFAKNLAAFGFVITSGLAAGVDGAAHQGALSAAGKTIAVMGTGIDQVYPRRHLRLAADIVANGGTLVTEFPLGAGPLANHFPRRNRIISALSVGVLVVEAAVKSGSLITARYAMQQDREVFAIPGSIHNPMSRGCHQLLKDGATLVESVDDMREPLQGLLAWHRAAANLAEANHQERSESPMQSNETPVPSKGPIKPNLIQQDLLQKSLMQQTSTEPNQPTLSNEEALVYTSVGFETADLDTLVLRTQLPIGELLSRLMGLELKGLIAQIPGGYQRRS